MKDRDYTIAYTNRTNVGTATVTVTGIGNYTGTSTRTFVINKAAAHEISWPTASAQLPTGKVSDSPLEWRRYPIRYFIRLVGYCKGYGSHGGNFPVQSGVYSQLKLQKQL